MNAGRAVRPEGAGDWVGGAYLASSVVGPRSHRRARRNCVGGAKSSHDGLGMPEGVGCAHFVWSHRADTVRFRRTSGSQWAQVRIMPSSVPRRVSFCGRFTLRLSGVLLIVCLAGLTGCATIAGSNPAHIYATRLFAGPTQYPPKDFKAYGIVAFKARPTPADLGRYEMICNAYVAGLLSPSEAGVPRTSQMVTVWPIDSDAIATRLNAMPVGAECSQAGNNYGLHAAQEAIASAPGSFAGAGPFLLAWSPSTAKGQSGAPVLSADLSDVTTPGQARDLFFQWSKDIQEKPELWEHGWSVEEIRVTIRLWADKYGSAVLKFLSDQEILSHGRFIWQARNRRGYWSHRWHCIDDLGGAGYKPGQSCTSRRASSNWHHYRGNRLCFTGLSEVSATSGGCGGKIRSAWKFSVGEPSATIPRRDIGNIGVRHYLRHVWIGMFPLETVRAKAASTTKCLPIICWRPTSTPTSPPPASVLTRRYPCSARSAARP